MQTKIQTKTGKTKKGIDPVFTHLSISDKRDESLNPFAKGLLSIFSFVICKKISLIIVNYLKSLWSYIILSLTLM